MSMFSDWIPNFWTHLKNWCARVVTLISLGLEGGPGALIALVLFGTASMQYTGFFTFLHGLVVSITTAHAGGGVAGAGGGIVGFWNGIAFVNTFVPLDLMVACMINYTLLRVGHLSWRIMLKTLAIVRSIFTLGLR